MSQTPLLPKVAFIGDESLALQCASIARSSGYPVAFIASRSADMRDRAAHDDFQVVDSTELAQFLGANHVDVLFSVANEFVVSDDVLSQVDRAVNFHDGPLPEYAGLAVTTWAIFNGETEHAVTWHTMTSQVDAGEVIVAQRFEISPDETAFSLNARCYEEALTSFPRVLQEITEHVGSFAPPSGRPGSWFGRYQRPIVLLDPATPAADLDRAVRSLALGPRIRNRLGAVRWTLGDAAFVVGATEIVQSSGQPVGTVVVSDRGLQLSTADGDLLVTELTTPDGDDVPTDELRRRIPTVVPSPARGVVNALAAADENLARHETFWSTRLLEFERTQPTHLGGVLTDGWSEAVVSFAADADAAEIATAVLGWWSRTSNHPTTWFEFSDDGVETTMRTLAPLVQRPIGRFSLVEPVDSLSARAAVSAELQQMSRRGPFLRDLVSRNPATRHRSIDPGLRIHVGDASSLEVSGFDHSATAVVEIVIPAAGGGMRLSVRDSVQPAVLQRCLEQIGAALEGSRRAPTVSMAELALIGPSESELLDQWNRTEISFDRDVTIDAQFRRQASRTPDAPAASCANATLSYAELESAVDDFASRLNEAGATRGSLVGVALDRDIDLLVAVLGVLTIGAAYVPLDPGYPQDRLAFMVSDSGLAVLVADADTAVRVAGPGLAVITPAVGGSGGVVDRTRADATVAAHTADDLAYVIYTSGSTGRPKGVMLEHRNVVNFFAAMDNVIEHDPPGTWLAVTSLSFDISVLELLWTVTRGLHVVIQKHGITSPIASGHDPKAAHTAARPTSLSLFFFAAGDSQASEGYRLLRESAQFADAHGFEAVWLPERHFHAFGGAYPNPSVLASAVAALTERIAIRAGSVVLPLHASARVAEEWAVVDNLSGGRVGISFAPGWQPNDFVLNPSGYSTARQDLQGRIDEVRALWRGEAVDMIGPEDRVVSVRTLPRPVQPELPVWLTSAGTTKTFEKAGEMGLNLLTHLLGQSPEQLADNIEVYRTAWRAAGHPGDGRITVMLHTFLSRDSSHAKKLAEQPMKQYLGSAAGLLKNMASAFPTFANAGVSADEAFKSLSESEMDELLSVAAARYLETSGLFGNIDDATDMAVALSAMGVDELACLIDFGIDTDDVLGSLPLLAELKNVLDAAAKPAEAGAAEPLSEAMADLVARHSVTHLQCTPSLAAMLLADPQDRVALGSIRHLMVGGEALPEKLGKELQASVSGRFTNMYGPTETTIWSLVHEIDKPPVGPVPIGHAVGNTSLHILDPAGQRLPIGALGELHIGGEGVARGYLGRDDLTAQRFVDRPGIGRVYATGDLARIHDGGLVEFAGRVDFQVKIRGHRIELGEIEAQLDSHPTVVRSVVVARGDAANAHLVAFVVLAADTDLDERLLRKHVGSVLPDVMVPDFVVALAALPLTPNGKVDRAALPTNIDRNASAAQFGDLVAPEDDYERLVADAWTEQLARPVGRTDNFFDIGGHSLLAVAVFRRLQQASELKIALTDVFRYPTVAAFAAYLKQLAGNVENGANVTGADNAAKTGVDRGALRRKLRESRRGGSG